MAATEIEIKLSEEWAAELRGVISAIESAKELLSEERIRQIVREELAKNRATLLQSLADEIRMQQGMR